jgi:simple sugar transport system permease protein
MNRFLARLTDPRTLPIVVTIALFAALFGFGSVMIRASSPCRC